ncbi:MAG: formylmethanofuran dehydrogenase subunit A [Promethearchaeota archaeon]
MAKPLVIKNGWVFDPLNGVEGERMDVAIEGGRVVEKVDESKARVIDASGMVVFPGGVDVHTHVAGAKVNKGRLFRPEDHYKDPVTRGRVTRAGSGYSVPSTYVTAYRYAQMGYTTVNEPAVPPLKARHTHEEFMDMPILDKTCMPVFGNNWFVLQYVREKEYDKLAAYVAWLLKATRGYAIKIVNPGGVENWAWGRNCESLDDHVDYWDVTPRDILTGLSAANEILGLPHSIHVHGNNLGHPGNGAYTIKTHELLEDVRPHSGRETVMHTTHCQFNCYGGSNWRDFCSYATEVANYVNSHPQFTIDAGQVIFTDTTTMTGDGPWEFALHHLTGTSVWGAKPGLKWINGQVEGECGSGVVPYIFKPKNPVNAVQWAIGLELMLLVKDPWRVFLTTDHPNGGPFTFYPLIVRWLMSAKTRQEWIEKRVAATVQSKTTLASIDREYTLEEVAVVTRAGMAKALGLERTKGHLGVGADGDVAVYRLTPETTDPHAIEKAFTAAAYTVKEGEVVVKDGEVVAAPMGRTIWTDATGTVAPDLMETVLREVRDAWYMRYSVNFNNYPVTSHYLPREAVVRPLA